MKAKQMMRFNKFGQMANGFAPLAGVLIGLNYGLVIDAFNMSTTVAIISLCFLIVGYSLIWWNYSYFVSDSHKNAEQGSAHQSTTAP